MPNRLLAEFSSTFSASVLHSLRKRALIIFRLLLFPFLFSRLLSIFYTVLSIRL